MPSSASSSSIAPPKHVQDIARRLLSNDPVEFNSVINTHFASHSTYRGHGLTVKGASNIKHVAFAINSIDAGAAAVLPEDAVQWDEETLTAHLEAIRFLRPRLFPFFELALPVKTKLVFEKPTGFDAPADEKKPAEHELLIAAYEDEWVAERLLSLAPGFAEKLYWSGVSPLVSSVFVRSSDVLFKLSSNLHRSSRHAYDAVEPSAKHTASAAERIVPRAVAQGLHRGVNDGMSIAEGLGEKIVCRLSSLISKPVQVFEWSADQVVNTVNPYLPRQLALPRLYLAHHKDDAFYLRNFKPSSSAGKKPQQEKKQSASPSTIVEAVEKGDGAEKKQEEKPKEPEQTAEQDDTPPQNDSTVHSPNVAQVEIGASADGTYGSHTVDIPQVAAEGAATNEPAPLAENGSSEQEGKKETLYDQLEKPVAAPAGAAAEEAPKASTDMGKSGSTGAHSNGSGGGKSGKNKKKHNKKH